MVRLLNQARDAASRRGTAIARWWDCQAWPMRLYSAGGLVILSAFVCALVGITYRGVHETIFVLGALLLASGILLEGYQLVDKGLATRIGKILAALVATMIGAFSMAISSIIVNEATGFPPSEFPYTVTFLAPLTAGYILVFATIVAFVTVPAVILIAGLVSMWPMRRRNPKETDRISLQTVVRLVAAIILFSLILTGWNKQHRPYEDSLQSMASWFAFTFEMYRNDVCVHDENERVRRMSNDVLVGRQHDGTRTFLIRRCAQVGEQ